MVEMAVFGDDVVGSSGNGAIDKLVIVLVDVAEQMETEKSLTVEDLWMTCNGLYHVVSHFWGCVQGENLLIFGQDFVADTQNVFAREEVSPYPMVLATRGQSLNETISKIFLCYFQKGEGCNLCNLPLLV